MTSMEEALGEVEFDPSSVRTGGVMLADLEGDDKIAYRAWCEEQLAQWTELRGMIRESWTLQERARGMLSRSTLDDSFAIGGLLGGTTAQFACASDICARHMARLKSILSKMDRDEDDTEESED